MVLRTREKRGEANAQCLDNRSLITSGSAVLMVKEIGARKLATASQEGYANYRRGYAPQAPSARGARAGFFPGMLHT
jgi:hypothetical protein